MRTEPQGPAGSRSRVLAALTLSLALVVGQAVFASPPQGEGPAHVENGVAESALPVLVLEPRAVERLGVRIVRIEASDRVRTREIGGIVQTPPGREIQVAAPQEGTVLAASGTGLPTPGTRVAHRQPLLRLLTLSSGELARAREVVEVAAARVAIGEERSAVDASAEAARELDEARSALAAAERRLRLLGGAGGEAIGGLAPQTVLSPTAGVVTSLRVSPGQAVPAGTVLLEVIATDPVWIRVPIYVGDRGSVRPSAQVRVRPLGARAAAALPGAPVAGPPTADPASATADLWFSVANPEGILRAGERVAVTLELEGEEAASAVPHAAILHDVNGGSWVYERLAPGRFVRRRVEVSWVRDGTAVLSRGPAPGTEIVTDGAAELFGAEFGTGK